MIYVAITVPEPYFISFRVVYFPYESGFLIHDAVVGDLFTWQLEIVPFLRDILLRIIEF